MGIYLCINFKTIWLPSGLLSNTQLPIPGGLSAKERFCL